MNKKYMLYGLLAAMLASAVPVAAQAEEWHGGREGREHWHGGHPDAWYYNPRFYNHHWVVAPVPAPVYVQQPYYYQPPAPVYYPPAPVYYAPAPVVGLGVSIHR